MAAGSVASLCVSAVRGASSARSPSAWCVRSDSFRARTSSSCSTQYVLSVKVEHPGNAQPCSIGINKTLTGPGRDWEATLDPMAGKCRNVLRILPGAVLVALLLAGCGGSSRPHRSATRGVPRALASEWASQASAVADAAAAGDSCQAAQLAAALRTDIIAKESRVPVRLQPA